jgi:hypothetical protein
VTGQWFSSGHLVSSTNKTDRHNITEILSIVALNTIKPNHSVLIVDFIERLKFMLYVLVEIIKDAAMGKF